MFNLDYECKELIDNFCKMTDMVEEKIRKENGIIMPPRKDICVLNDDFTFNPRRYDSTFNYRRVPEIEKVIFNDPATIVMWTDHTKTVVKCGEGDIFDPEKGLAMAISKKALGDRGDFKQEFKKWIPEEETVVISASEFAEEVSRLGRAVASDLLKGLIVGRDSDCIDAIIKVVEDREKKGSIDDSLQKAIGLDKDEKKTIDMSDFKPIVSDYIDQFYSFGMFEWKPYPQWDGCNKSIAIKKELRYWVYDSEDKTLTVISKDVWDGLAVSKGAKDE